MSWVVGIVALLIGFGGVSVALAWRLGRLHLPGEMRYFDRGLPVYQRTLILGLLPLSISFLAISAMPLARDTLPPQESAFVLALLGWILILSGLFAIVSLSWPAHWLKPAWLREKERLAAPHRGVGASESGPDETPVTVSRELPSPLWWTFLGGFIAFGIAIPVFHLPTTWFAGVLLGAAALLRVRRRSN